MEWQHLVADVAGEIDPATGQLAYDEIVLTVPRQSGKTTWKLAKAVHRGTATGFFGPRQQMVYTAQTRNKAREKFEREWAPLISDSATFGSRITPHWGNGNEHLAFRNGSIIGIEAATEKAGHGGTLHEAYVDEAFALPDDRLEVAFDPAMATTTNHQLVIVSTMGWATGSPYLMGKVEVGRQTVESGSTTRTAYFEWSAPDDADPGDEAVWWACMPALGRTISIATIRSAYDKAVRSGKLQAFRRSHLNQCVERDAAEDTVVDLDAWAALVDTPQVRPAPVAFAVEVSPDRRWSTIGLAGTRADGHRQLQIVQTGRGTGWVAPRVAELRRQWRPVAVAVAEAGPAGALIPDLRAHGVKVRKITGREEAQACGGLVDAIAEATVRHDGQNLVEISLRAATRRQIGRTWTWASRNGTDISPLRALTIAHYALAAAPASRRADPATPARRVVVLT